jgi:hypothetical protein
MRAYK